MTQLPAKPVFDEFRGLLVSKRDDLIRLVPADVPDKARYADRFIQSCVLAAARNPSILQCTGQSKARAMFTAMVLGLLPDVLGSGYFVPYKNKKGASELTWITGYQGMVELAHRSGHVSHIDARIVYKGDTFDIRYGTDAQIIHKPQVEASHQPESKADLSCGALNILGAYAVVTFKDGGKKFEWMPAEELDGVRKRSRAKSSPWHEWPDVLEMYKKCPLRRLSKTIPQTPDLHLALGMDDAAERGTPQITEDFIDTTGDVQDGGEPGDPKPCPKCGSPLTMDGCEPLEYKCTKCDYEGRGE